VTNQLVEAVLSRILMFGGVTRRCVGAPLPKIRGRDLRLLRVLA